MTLLSNKQDEQKFAACTSQNLALFTYMPACILSTYTEFERLLGSLHKTKLLLPIIHLKISFISRCQDLFDSKGVAGIKQNEGAEKSRMK